MIILGIDPGIARVGWGVIKDERGKLTAIEYGCFETSPKLNADSRLLKIHQFVFNLINKYKANILAVEQVFFGANAKTALIVGQARGVIILTAALKNLETVSYTPLQIKMALTGYGRADKIQIQNLVSSILNIKSVSQDDTADALAVALTHAFSYKLHSIIQKEK